MASWAAAATPAIFRAVSFGCFEALHGTTRDDLDGLETAGLELSVQVLFPNVFVEEAILNECESIGINRRRFQD
jgi:hypothetical protein